MQLIKKKKRRTVLCYNFDHVYQYTGCEVIKWQTHRELLPIITFAEHSSILQLFVLVCSPHLHCFASVSLLSSALFLFITSSWFWWKSSGYYPLSTERQTVNIGLMFVCRMCDLNKSINAVLKRISLYRKYIPF